MKAELDNLQIIDLFGLEEIQSIQDSFSDATGVALVLTSPDGKPITKACSICSFCREIIQSKSGTPEGNCFFVENGNSGLLSENTKTSSCYSGLLWNSEINIKLGNAQLATWHTGRLVYDNKLDQTFPGYTEFLEACSEYAQLSEKQFNKVLHSLKTISGSMAIKAVDCFRLKNSSANGFIDNDELKSLSDQNLEITLKSIGDGVIVTNKTGEIVNMNPVAETLCGWKLFEAAGQHLNKVFNIINAESRKTVDDPVSKVLETGQIVGLANHTILISRNGTEYQIADSAAPIVNNSGVIDGVVLVFSDVTQNYYTNKKIEKSEMRYRSLLTHLEAGVVVHAPDTSILMNNPKASELLGLSDEQMRGTLAMDPKWRFMHYDGTVLPLDEYPVNRVLSEKKPFSNLEVGVYRPASNDEVWLRVDGFPLLDEAGAILEVIISFVDNTERRKAEYALRESEDKYRLLVENQNDLVVKVNSDGIFQFVNQPYCQTFGKTESELIGRSFYPLVHEDDQAHTRKEMEKLFAPPYKCIFEQRALTKAGWRWFSWSDSAVLNENQEVVAIIGIGRDITIQKEARQEIIRMEHHLRALIENAPDGVVLINAEGQFRFVSPSARRIFGYPPDYELSKADPNSLTHPDDLPFVLETLNEIILNPKNIPTIEYRFSDTHGKWKWVESTFTNLLADPNVESIVINFRDITQRKLAEEKLYHEQLLLRTLIDNIPDSIYSKDTQYRKTLANPADVRYMGAKSESEVLGKSDFDFYPAEMAEKFTADDRKVLETAEPVLNREEYILDSNGQKKWLLSSKIPLRDKNGAVSGIIGIGRDITERKKVEQALHIKNVALDSSLIAMGITDVNGNITYVNKALVEMWAAEDESHLIGKPAKSFWINENSANSFISNCIKEGFGKGEFLARRLNGTTFETYAYASVVKNEKGAIEGVVASFDDLTDRKLAEAALRESEEKYRILFMNSPDAYLIIIDGIFTDCNKAAEAMMGCKADQIIGKTPGDISPEYQPDGYSSHQKAAEMLSKAIERGFNNFNWVHIRPDGTEFTVGISIASMNYDNQQAFFITWRDITAMVLAEQKQRSSEEKYRLIFENSPMGILSFDEKGVITACNESFSRIIGSPVDVLVGLNMLQLPDTRLVSAVSNAIHGQTGIFEDKYTSFTSGKTSDVRAIFTSIGDINKPGGGMGIIEDITERKKAEAAQKASEEKYRSIFENVQDVFYQATLEGVILEVSPSIKHFSEFDRQELIGSNVQKLYLNPSDRDQLVQTITQNGELQDYEIALKTRSSQIRYVSLNARLVFGEDGLPKHIDGSLRDITDRKLAEKALNASEELYRNLVLNLPDGVYKSTHEGRFIDVNPAMATMLGYESKDELMQVDIKTALYFSPEDRESVELREDMIETGVYRMKKKDGSEIWVEDHGWLNADENDNIMYHEGILRDVTERKHAEEELRKNEERLRTILQTAMDGFWLVDLNGNIIACNDTYCRLSGYSKDEIINLPISKLEAIESGSDIAFRIQEIAANHEARFETMHKRKDGSVFDVEVSVQYHPADDGMLVAFIKDITEQKQAQLEIIRAREKAEESDRLKSAFLANMSHEIRTPMNGILGFAELLKEPGLTGEQQQEYLRIIKKSGDRMLNIINDIVDISKIESGLMKVALQPTCVNEQLEYIYNFFRPEAEKKQIHFYYEKQLDKGSDIIITDKEKLYAILINLVKNAIKYTPSGFIEFGCSLTNGNQNNELLFFVRDSGIGIHPDRQEAIFERFIQADVYDKRALQGAGLGLSITKAYVEMLGGKLTVESEFGQGSTFYFTIPYNTPQTVEKETLSQQKYSESKTTGKNLKILIAEDEETSDMLISIALRAVSHNLLHARTGNEAVQLCKDNPDTDLILMDIQMPEIDGYEATRLIRKFNKEIIIIAQTAYALSGEFEKALQAGCNDYISKPISKEQLLEMVASYFGGKS